MEQEQVKHSILQIYPEHGQSSSQRGQLRKLEPLKRNSTSIVMNLCVFVTARLATKIISSHPRISKTRVSLSGNAPCQQRSAKGARQSIPEESSIRSPKGLSLSGVNNQPNHKTVKLSSYGQVSRQRSKPKHGPWELRSSSVVSDMQGLCKCKDAAVKIWWWLGLRIMIEDNGDHLSYPLSSKGWHHELMMMIQEERCDH